jgi:hypothetical protein
MIFHFEILARKYAICKFKSNAILPDWIYSSEFYSITRTTEELTVILIQTDEISQDIVCSKDWRILKVAEQLDLSLIGIIADISGILKEKKIPIFTISTYDTDYFLIREKDLNTGIKALKDKGHKISFNK